VVLIGYIEADHIATVPALDFLLVDDLATFVFRGALQESYPAIPLGGSDPEIGLLVEECHITDFLGAQVQLVLSSFIEEYRARVDIIELDESAHESYSDDSSIRAELHSLDLVTLLEVAQVVCGAVLLVGLRGLLERVAADACAGQQVPLPD